MGLARTGACAGLVLVLQACAPAGSGAPSWTDRVWGAARERANLRWDSSGAAAMTSTSQDPSSAAVFTVNSPGVEEERARLAAVHRARQAQASLRQQARYAREQGLVVPPLGDLQAQADQLLEQLAQVRDRRWHGLRDHLQSVLGEIHSRVARARPASPGPG